MRRAVDLAVAVAAAIILLPLMAIIGACSAIAMGRPVLFSQIRSGKGGEPFSLIKFRTMTDHTDSEGRLLDDSARTTPFGRLLRRTRLDELPELWNVIRGDMSLIGPRPLLPETIEEMGAAGIARGVIRPGLTGWAQVNGGVLLSDTAKVTLDLWYIRHRSLRCDLEIIFRTISFILAGERMPAQKLDAALVRDSYRES